MARGVNHIDGDFFAARVLALVGNCGVLGENRDALFALEITRVHDALTHVGVIAERASLAKHCVDQRGLSVVYVGNDCYVAQVIS